MITVRRAESADIPTLQKLLYQVEMVHHVGRPDLFRCGGTKYTARQLRSILKKDATPVFVAVDDQNTVLGYAFCVLIDNRGHNILTDIQSLYIDDLCVDEGCRGKHIGKLLYDFVLDFARAQG